jgi:hypothetical protein
VVPLNFYLDPDPDLDPDLDQDIDPDQDLDPDLDLDQDQDLSSPILKKVCIYYLLSYQINTYF